MPPTPTSGSSRRKQGQPTVCLDCYLRKVKCDRKRPCSTCVRRGTEHLCKTFSTSELDPEALKKKQARRSLAEINAMVEAANQAHVAASSSSDESVSASHHNHPSTTTSNGKIKSKSNSKSNSNSNNSNGHGHSHTATSPSEKTVEPPLTSFINLLLKDLSLQEHSSDPGLRPSSAPPPISLYREPATFDALLSFCRIVPDWSRLQRIIDFYLMHIDWKFMVTAQDLLEPFMHDLWQRVVVPLQDFGATVNLDATMRPGDLSRIALLACILCETVESVQPNVIPTLFPAGLTSWTAPGPGRGPGPGTATRTRTRTHTGTLPDSPRVVSITMLVHHIQVLIQQCELIGEMTLELVQSNVSAFSIFMSQGLFGRSNFPKWELTIRAARESGLFEDPERLPALSQHELDHRRRLAWLVYGYDHGYAVGSNMKPLISDSQFSVDRPSDLPPWSAVGCPPDPCLAMLEVDVAKVAAMLSSTLCWGQPLHRKVMQIDNELLAIVARLHPTWALDSPDRSMDVQDPFRARRRPWLSISLYYHRALLHRGFFFPNGRITNSELATSRHIVVDSTLRGLEKIRELRTAQNRFSDWQGSAWYYQYITEPSIALATATLLLIRSKGEGVLGISDAPSCWPTVCHFTKVLDDSLADIDNSIRDPTHCLDTMLGFGKRCSQMIRQLRSAIQSSIDAHITADPTLDVSALRMDDRLTSLLNPRARQPKSSRTPTPQPAQPEPEPEPEPGPPLVQQPAPPPPPPPPPEWLDPSWSTSLTSTEPFALRSHYTDERIQRAAPENRGLADWIVSVQMGVLIPPPESMDGQH